MSHENYHVSRQNTGLGMFLNQNNTSSWEGSAQDYEPTVSDKDYNSQSFYCEVCDIDCTSENQYEAHVNGKNHFKRLKLQGQDGEYQTGHENDHEHRRIAGVGVFLTQGVSASRATSQDYEPTVSVKDYARPFFCKVCHIDCTSDNALEAHLIGKNHMKKLRQLGQEEEEHNVPPFKLAPKWVYLSHKVMVETSEPIIGLQYVDEFLKETKPAECEPRYTCNLCAVTGEIEPFWSHMIGTRHRTKYMEMVLKLTVDKGTVFQLAKEVEQDEGRNITLISRIVSDEKYPVPESPKLPKKPPKKPTLSLTDPDSPVQRLLEAIVEGAIKKNADAELAFNTAHSLILKLAQHKAKASPDPPQTMKAWDEVLSRLVQLDKVCPNPPDPDPSKETKPSKNLPSLSVEHSEHVQISEPLIPNKRVYQNERVEQSEQPLSNKRSSSSRSRSSSCSTTQSEHVQLISEPPISNKRVHQNNHVEHSEHFQQSEPPHPNKRVYQNEHIQQNKPNLQQPISNKRVHQNNHVEHSEHFQQNEHLHPNKRVHQNEHVQSNEDKSVNFRGNSENSQNLNSRLFNMSESSPGPSKARWSHNQPSTSMPKNGWDHQPLLPQQSKQRPNFQAKTISELNQHEDQTTPSFSPNRPPNRGQNQQQRPPWHQNQRQPGPPSRPFKGPQGHQGPQGPQPLMNMKKPFQSQNQGSQHRF